MGKERQVREQMLIRLPAGLKEWLRKEAGGMGITLNALVLRILWDWVKQNEKSRD